MENGFEFVLRANDKSERMWSMYVKYVVVLYFFNMTMTGVGSVLFGFLMQGHFVVNLAFHPFQFEWVEIYFDCGDTPNSIRFTFILVSLPWDQNTIIGYFNELLFGICSAESYLIAIGSLLLLFISLCQHFHGFSQMNQRLFDEFICTDDMRVTHQRLCKVIKFHISVKEWVEGECFQFRFPVNLNFISRSERWFLLSLIYFADLWYHLYGLFDSPFGFGRWKPIGVCVEKTLDLIFIILAIPTWGRLRCNTTHTDRDSWLRESLFLLPFW